MVSTHREKERKSKEPLVNFRKLSGMAESLGVLVVKKGEGSNIEMHLLGTPNMKSNKRK